MKIKTFVNRGTGQAIYGFQYDLAARDLEDDGEWVLPDGLKDQVLKHGLAGDRHLVSGQFVAWKSDKVVEVYEKKAFEAAFAPLDDEDIRCVDLMMEQIRAMRSFSRHVRLGMAAVDIPRTLAVRVTALLDAVDSFDTLLREDDRRQAAALQAAVQTEVDASAAEEEAPWEEE